MASESLPEIEAQSTTGLTSIARATIVAASIGTLLIFVAASFSLPVIQDEAYYWTWAQAPAWTYFDHPPSVAWLLRLSTSVFGSSLLGLRFWSMLSVLAIVGLSLRSAASLAGDASSDAMSLAMVMLLGSPMFVVGMIPGTPDPYLAAMTALSAATCVRALESGRGRAIFLAAASTTLLVGIKHYGALISVGALLGLVCHPRGRSVLRRPACLAGIGFALVAMSPWWANELASGREASFVFQASRVFEASSRFEGLRSIPVTLGSLMGTLGPVSAVALVLVASVGVRDREEPIDAVLAGGAIALLLGCALAVWLGSGEANWPFPAFVFALPLVAARAARRERWSRWIVGGGLVFNALLLVYLAHVVHPFLSLDLRRDPAARAAGFDRVADEAEQMSHALGAGAIIAMRYQSASLLRYHLRDRVAVFEARPEGARRSQYDRWSHPPLCAGDVALLVSRDREAWRQLPGSVIDGARSVARKREGLSGEEVWWLQPMTVSAPGLACDTRER